VGLHKTGTTAFQRAAACGADSQPLLYPHLENRNEGDFSHNILVGYMHTHRATYRKNPVPGDPGVSATHEMRMLRELFQERWRTATVLLSAEEFARELVHDDRARQWQDLCSGFPTVRVALVLRRFDHLRNSVASEKSKTSFHGNLLSGPRGWGYVCYDVSALLRLASSFGWRVDIFSYDRLTAEGTLVQELGNWCGLVTDGLPSASIKTRANAKFHRRKTLFCSLLDKTQLSVGQREGLVRSIGRSSAIADDGVEFLYSPPGTRCVLCQHEAAQRRSPDGGGNPRHRRVLSLQTPGARYPLDTAAAPNRSGDRDCQGRHPGRYRHRYCRLVP
jgi:hypothetical protein